MAVLGVDDFKSKLRGGGARPNLFKVTINYPGFANGDAELTSFLCEAASLPGSTFGIIPVAFRGRILKMAGDRTFAEWNTTIINDTDFSVRDAIERWMNGINAHSANTGLTSPIAYEAYPQDLSEITLSYGDNDNIERFNCIWAYQYYESNTTS